MLIQSVTKLIPASLPLKVTGSDDWMSVMVIEGDLISESHGSHDVRFIANPRFTVRMPNTTVALLQELQS